MSNQPNISAQIKKRRSGTMISRINSSDSLNFNTQRPCPIDLSDRRNSTINSDLFDGANFFDSISSESNLLVDPTKNIKLENSQDDDLSQFEKFIVAKKVVLASQSSVKKEQVQQKQITPSNHDSKQTKVSFSEKVQLAFIQSSKKDQKLKPINMSNMTKVEPQFISLPEAQKRLDQLIKKSNSNFLSYTDQFTISMEKLRSLSNTLKSLRNRNIKFARNFMKYEIVLDLITKEFYEGEIERVRSNIDNCAKFQCFISQKDKNTVLIDFMGFIRHYITPQIRQKDFIRKTTILNAKIRSLPQQHLLNDPNDIFSHYMDSTTETGRIMHRFKVKVAELRYPDIELIADAISEKEKAKPSDVVNILFDCAWYFINYPICDPFKCSKISRATDTIIPKVFDPPFLEEEWNYMTFSELSSSNWPLKPAVDELFDLMILTNPFDIARKFYSIINTIGKCVQRIFIWQNKESKFIDIDFDQLFVLMLLCIFTSGLTEIVAPMIYSYSFREFIMEDYQIQYAMSHMEGLCQHIKNIDWNETKRKSQELQEKHVNALPEPLVNK